VYLAVWQLLGSDLTLRSLVEMETLRTSQGDYNTVISSNQALLNTAIRFPASELEKSLLENSIFGKEPGQTMRQRDFTFAEYETNQIAG
jgi:hypothetical protein